MLHHGNVFRPAPPGAYLADPVVPPDTSFPDHRGGAWLGPSAVPAAAHGTGFGAAKFIAALRRQWVLVLLCAATGTSLAVAAGVLLPPRYSAEALIEVVGPRDVPIGNITAAPAVRIDPAVIQTVAQELRTRALAVHVVGALQLWEDKEFVAPGLGERVAAHLRRHAARLAAALGFDAAAWTGEPELQGEARLQERAVNTLLRRLQVAADDRSYLLKVRLSDAVPEKAAHVVNAAVEGYLSRRAAAREDATVRAGEWLGGRVAEAGKRMQESTLAVQRFREARKLLTAEGETLSTGPTSQLAELYKQLVAAKSDVAASEANLQDVRQLADIMRQSGRSDVRLDGPSQASAAAVLASPVIQNLRTQQADAARRAAQLRATYGENHPILAQARAEIASLQAAIMWEVDRIVAGLANNARTAQARVAVLEKDVADLRARIGQINRGEAELQALQQAADADRVVYQTLLAKLNDTTNGFGLAPPDVRIVAPAAPAVSPSFPKKGLFTVVGLLVSGLSGVGLGLLRDHRQRRGFISSSDVEAMLGLPVGAMIPRTRRLSSPQQEIRRRPGSAYAEAVRGIWPALGFSDDQSPIAVMVTSSVPDEGKSTLVVSLASSLAAGGRRIAVIDLDLRRAGLTTALKLEGAPGIVQYLANQLPAGEAVIDRGPGVGVIPAGHSCQGVPELLSAVQTRAKLRALIGELKQSHDVVLIDSPPALAVSDAAWVAKLADGVVYAVRWRETPRAAAAAGLNQMKAAGATLFGAVMTQVDLRRHSGYDSGDAAHFHKLHRGYYVG